MANAFDFRFLVVQVFDPTGNADDALPVDFRSSFVANAGQFVRLALVEFFAPPP
jgi:hypothetical protein